MEGAVKGRRKNPCQITVRQDRLVLSRPAAERLSEYIDLYECGQILALKGNIDGRIRLSMSSHKFRQNIRAREIVDYIRNKYECEMGGILTAWYRDETLMFGKYVTEEDKALGFGKSFRKVEVETQLPETYGVRTRGQVTSMSGAAGRLFESNRLTVYECDDLLAFVPDENGDLEMTVEKDGRTKSIHSSELTRFIQEKYGAENLKLCGWQRGGILFCSDRRSARRLPFSEVSFGKLSFEMSKDIVTVNILQNSRLLISANGAAVLRGHISLYEHDGIMALVSDAEGEFKAMHRREHAGCDITGRDLVRRIKECLDLDENPNCVLPAQVRGGAVYFSKRELKYIPAFGRFEKVSFGRVCEPNVVSVSATPGYEMAKFYISRSMQKHLTGALSLYRKEDVWAFASTPAGTLNMSGSGNIVCRGLEEHLRSEMCGAVRLRFYVREHKGNVYFSRRRFKDDEDLRLEKFKRVTGDSGETVVQLSGVLRNQTDVTAAMAARSE